MTFRFRKKKKFLLRYVYRNRTLVLFLDTETWFRLLTIRKSSKSHLKTIRKSEKVIRKTSDCICYNFLQKTNKNNFPILPLPRNYEKMSIFILPKCWCNFIQGLTPMWETTGRRIDGLTSVWVEAMACARSMLKSIQCLIFKLGNSRSFFGKNSLNESNVRPFQF